MARSLRPFEVFPITTRTLKVLRVEDITPGMRRVTLGGPELEAHTAANGFPVAEFRSDGFDDEFKLILQHPAATELVGPTQADGVLNWPRDNENLLFRTYSARRWNAQRRELEVDFVKHGVGLATTWAYRVQPGEKVQIAGPKSSSSHPVGADWTLIAGDETALPSIGRWLEEWPTGARAQIFVEVAEQDHVQHFDLPQGVEITWLTRNGAEPGSTTLLFDALKAASWWDGKVFAWVAGETLTLIPIRRWLRNEKNLAKDQVDVTGYWRRQEVVVSAEDPSVQDLAASQDAPEFFHELAEIIPSFALRIAASIDLAGAFDNQPRTIDQLIASTGTNVTGLAKLIRYLTALEITVLGGDGKYRLTSLGRQLENDRIADSLNLDQILAQRELGGALSLLAAVRTGHGDHARWFGGPFADHIQNSTVLLSEKLEDDAENAVYVAGALAQAPAFSALGTLSVTGNGAGVIADSLVQNHPLLNVTIFAPPSELEVISSSHTRHDRIAYEPGSPLNVRNTPVDGVLLLDGVFSTLPDADAVYALRQASASLAPGGRVFVFGDVFDTKVADEHDYEDDLIDFALYGGGVRDQAEHTALFESAGLVVHDRSTIGWGYTLFNLKEV